jgi:hypothetical protein
MLSGQRPLRQKVSLMTKKLLVSRHSRGSRRLNKQDAAIIKKRINDGELFSRIAADFDVNQGRISEINTGKRFADVTPVA